MSDNPAEFDALMSDPTRRAAYHPGNDDLGKVRRALLTLAGGDRGQIPEMLAVLEHVQVPPARGVRLMLQATIGDHAEVLAADMAPAGAGLLELEDTCFVHAAAAVAYAQTGTYEQALRALEVSIAFGRSIGLRNRVSIMEIERERIETLRGTPRPEQIEQLLRRPMSPRRKDWGRRTWAEALMSLGDYRSALRVLGHPSADDRESAALRDFLHVCLQLPRPESRKDLPYSRLASAIVGLEAGAPHQSLLDIEGEPMTTYACLLEACALVRQPGTAVQGARLLGTNTLSRPDQAILQALLWITALANGARHPRPAALFDVLGSTDLRLRTSAPIAGLITRLLPETSLLLSLTPFGNELALRTVDIPVITGPDLVWRGQHHRLPAQSGEHVVKEALGLPVDDLHRQVRKRLNTRLTEIGAPHAINLGQLLTTTLDLQRRSRAAGLPRGERFWQDAWKQGREMLAPSVQQMYPEDIAAG